MVRPVLLDGEKDDFSHTTDKNFNWYNFLWRKFDKIPQEP